MNNPKYIIIHHSAVSYDKNPNQFDAINQYHKDKGWGEIGYHYLIEKDGTLKTGRHETEVGAHCYQDEMNYKSIGVCLTGNFDIELPTEAQKRTLERLLENICGTYHIEKYNVLNHRDMADYKSCPGNLMPDHVYELFNQKAIKENELILAKRMDKAWDELDQANATKKYLSELKGKEFIPYEII